MGGNLPPQSIQRHILRLHIAGPSNIVENARLNIGLEIICRFIFCVFTVGSRNLRFIGTCNEVEQVEIKHIPLQKERRSLMDPVNCPTRWFLLFIFGFLCWSSEKYRTAMCYDGSCFTEILNLFRNKVSRFDSLEFMSNSLNFVGTLPFGFIWWKIEDRDFWIWKLWAILRKVQRRKASILMDGWGLSNHAEYFFEVVFALAHKTIFFKLPFERVVKHVWFDNMDWKIQILRDEIH